MSLIVVGEGVIFTGVGDMVVGCTGEGVDRLGEVVGFEVASFVGFFVGNIVGNT